MDTPIIINDTSGFVDFGKMTKIMDTKEQALRYNTGKPEWSLVDYKALEPMVRVLEFGAKKYSRNNWQKGLYTREICESMLRHIFEYLDGIDKDAESECDITGHILCNAMFLSYMMQNKKEEFDNRKK